MNASSQALIRQIVAHVTCAVCGHHFGVSDIQVVGRREHVWAMRVCCRECHSQALLLAVVNDTGTKPVYTDLVPEEWEHFEDAPPVSADDVISIHKFLQSHSGDLGEQLRDPLAEED